VKITKIHIEKFRGFQNEDFELGSQLTAIAGQNGTQKSTLLGIVTQTFTLKFDDPMRAEKPLCGGSYISAFKDKFRLSPTFDKPKGHEWTISFDSGIADFTVESIKRTGDPNVRFWKKGARQEGDGYISFPTIFLSLKRLVPAAEETKIITDDTLLTVEELNEFKQLHNKILIAQTPISSATAITSKNKQSVGVSTGLYDWNQNSMGQDNLGKIILALFSFKRLQEKYPGQYKGGILAIDEMDATMYPASQVELLKILRKYASKLKLQILFTTHSMSLLKAMDELVKEVGKQVETINQVKLLYLKKIDDKIVIKQNIDIKGIQLDLNVVAEGNNRKKNKITVYTEDKENILLAKAILKSKASVLDFVDVTLSCSLLIELVNKNIPAFKHPYSIVILDGDIKEDRNRRKKIKNADNILVLPGNKSPERLLASYLHNLSDADSLWSSIANGYSKQVCFREYSLEQINASGEDGRQNAKTWFNNQREVYWGRNMRKILNSFLNSISAEVQEFNANFDKMIKRYIHD
jgi:hypothetical protein